MSWPTIEKQHCALIMQSPFGSITWPAIDTIDSWPPTKDNQESSACANANSNGCRLSVTIGRPLIEWLTTLIRVHVLQASERVEGIKLSEFRVTVRPEWHIYIESVSKRASCCRLPRSEGSREMK